MGVPKITCFRSSERDKGQRSENKILKIFSHSKTYITAKMVRIHLLIEEIFKDGDNAAVAVVGKLNTNTN